MSRLIVIILLFTGIVEMLHSQDAHFSQYYNTMQTINPSLLGKDDAKGSLDFNFRNQWGGLNYNTFRTFAFSGNIKVNNDKQTLGMQILSDKSGMGNFKTSDISFTVAQKIVFNKEHSLKLGIQAGIIDYSYDASNLTWNSQFDGNELNPNIQSGEKLNKSNPFLNISSGLSWKYQSKDKMVIHSGISAYHINKPVYNTFTQKSLALRWCSFTDATIPISKTSFRIQPSLLFMKQGNATEITIGSIVKNKLGTKYRNIPDKIASFISFGAFYRNNDAFIFLAGLSFQEQMVVYLSYDVTISKLATVSKSNGGIECTIQYLINY